MIYVVEGVDGTGKSTLCQAIANEVNGLVIHSTFNREWNIYEYNRQTMEYAQALSAAGINVILDRWAVSEEIYGTVFRAGPSYDTLKLIREYDNIVWIYCRNDNAVENHLRNQQNRVEMFRDVSEAARLYDEYVSRSDLNWSVFNFEEVITDDFIEDLLG